MNDARRRVSDFERQQADLEDFISRVSYVPAGTGFHVTTWNVDWAPPRKRDAIRERIARFCPSGVFILTEGDRAVLPEGGHAIDGGPDWGYRVEDPSRRKVILWSDEEMSDVDIVGSPDLPPGRFAAGTLTTPEGPVRIIAVCIPWRDAHVRTGRRKAKPWGEHIAYLEALRPLLDEARQAMPVCVAGDFNQRIPSTWTPRVARDAMAATFEGFTILTAGEEPLSGLAEQTVDHIAVSEGLTSYSRGGVDCGDTPPSDGTPPRSLSDHHLITCSLVRDA